MRVSDQARRLAEAGNAAEAVALLEGSDATNDPDAVFTLAQWRLFGLNGPRDLGAAHVLLERAGTLGSSEAICLRATLIANGTGCNSDPGKAQELLGDISNANAYAALQLAFAKMMLPPESVKHILIEVLRERPFIRCARAVLTREECDYLRGFAEPHLEPSFVQHPETGERIPHPIRTSTGMSFGPTQEDLVVHRINRRLAGVTGTAHEWGEPLHILRYGPGQEYRPHVDYLPGTDNQRQWTVLIYLNDGYGGGSTRFDLAGIDFAGQQGDALIFRNIDESGFGDPATRHAGQPVTSGVKWLATRWIRQRRYHPWDE